MISVVLAEASHVDDIMLDLRDADRDEWVAGGARPIRMALLRAVTPDVDTVARTALDERGVALCMWGGCDGRLWLVATNAAVPRAVSLHRVLGPWLQELVDRWGTLTAVADKRNIQHHRWLKWLGFKPVREVRTGPFGLPFIQFERD